MEQIQSEIVTLKQQINALRQERVQLTPKLIVPANNSPQGMVEACRRFARENPQLSVELKGIDDAIFALEKQLEEKRIELNKLQRTSQRQSIEEELEAAREKAKIHAERINQLSAELASEIRILKGCADKLSPLYWQVYYKPFITGFKTISVPYVRSDGDVWTIVNRIV
jgi:septal ring factor EnvC (AmiA/AmiB activator)